MRAFLRDPGALATGPYPLDDIRERVRSGTLDAPTEIALARPGAVPGPNEYRPATADNVAHLLDRSGRAADLAAASGADTSRPGQGWMRAAGVLAALAVLLVVFGLYTMYTYDAGTDYESLRSMLGDDSLVSVPNDGPVGGDAYNYIIRANWGAGWIASGVACATLSVVATLGALRSTLLAR